MELNWGRRDVMWLLITPAIAAIWLQFRNQINRPVRDSNVDKYVRDTLSGNWHVTGESISFDWNGQLINGQHRLEVIIETGVAVEYVVVTGLDPNIRPDIDNHGKRSMANAFEFAGKRGSLGEGGSVGRNTAAGMWSRMKHGIVASKGHDTHRELLTFAETYPEGGLFALEEFGKHPRKSVFLAPVMAAVARAYYHFSSDDATLARLSRFVALLATGKGQTARADDVVILLREWLIDNKNRHGRNSNVSHEIYGKTARTITAFMAGEIISRIYCPTEEPFPLPIVSTDVGRAPRMAFDDAGSGAGRSRVGSLVAHPA